MNSIKQHTALPLCVDLDGTLIATDTLWESILILLRTNPFIVFLLPIWLLSGKAYLKHKIAQQVTLAVDILPYREEVIQFLQQEKNNGRPLILATAAHFTIANAVADYTQLFSSIIASDEKINLKGTEKRNALLQRFGAEQFDYMGDSMADLPILTAANTGYLVNPSHALRKRYPSEHIITVAQPSWKTWLKALRPHQWVKNGLIFLPLALAHQFLDVVKLGEGCIAFFAFSLAASAGYILNDLLDLPADRIHPTKKRRPFAAGKLSIPQGIFLFIFLVITSVSLSLWLSLAFTGILVLYLIITITYSLYLKRKMVVDVLVLAGLYTHRIVAGGIAVNVAVSSWLLAFSMFIFMSLAFLKRYIELLQLTERKSIKNRNYLVDDIEMIASVGPTNGYLAILVFSLYINSEATLTMYKSPFILWLICPILLYWITRIWFLARRGQVADDPVQFALTDKNTWFVTLCIIFLVLLGKFV